MQQLIIPCCVGFPVKEKGLYIATADYPCCVGPPEKEKGMYIATTDYPLVHEIDPDTLRVKQAIPFTGNSYSETH